MISGGRAASISERESSLAFLKMTHYSTQPYARIDVGGKATRRCDLLPSGGAGDWRGPLQRWREQLQLFSPALLRARRRASVPTLQHSPSIHSREATRPHARPRPHLLCFNVLPWSQRASRHDSIAMAGALWTATVRGRCAAARAGAAQIRALAPSIQFRIQLSLFCRLEQPVLPFSGWWIAHSLHGGCVNLVHTGWMRKAPPPYGPARWTVFVVGMDSLGVAVQRITAE